MLTNMVSVSDVTDDMESADMLGGAAGMFAPRHCSQCVHPSCRLWLPRCAARVLGG